MLITVAKHRLEPEFKLNHNSTHLPCPTRKPTPMAALPAVTRYVISYPPTHFYVTNRLSFVAPGTAKNGQPKPKNAKRKNASNRSCGTKPKRPAKSTMRLQRMTRK